MQNSLLTALELTKRQVKLVSIASVAAAWSAVTILLLLAFVVWDHWRTGGVPGWAATTLRMIYLVGTAAWLTAAVVLPLVRHISDIYAARLIERGHPEFGNVLVGAVQLARREELPGSVRVAIVEQASREVGHTDVRRSVPRGALRVWAMLLLAASVSFVGYSVVAPKSIVVSLRRALGARLAAPTRTTLRSVEPADGLRVLRGQDVLFRVNLGGRDPGEVVVRFSTDGGQTWPIGQQMRLMPAGRDGAWRGTRVGADVQVSMLWQVVAGDGQSDPRRLVVVPEPAIVDMQIRYEYPRYTGLPPATQPGGDIDALVGTRATLQARTNVPVLQPVLIVGEGDREQRRVPSQSAAARPRHSISTEILVVEDDTYQLSFRDEDGHTNVPIRHRIQARLDQLPMVDWQDESPQIEVPASDLIPLQARAQDDFGLTRAVLGWRKTSDRVTREMPLTLRGGAAGQFALSKAVTSDELGLAAGESADLWVTVWDNREDPQGRPAYQRADSAIRHLVIQRPPTTAPTLAERPRPARRVSESRPAKEAMANREGDEPDQLASARPSRSERTLQELVNEHEKELALIESKLAREMQSEPGGRYQSTLPELARTRASERGKADRTASERGAENKSSTPGEGQASSASGPRTGPPGEASQGSAAQPDDSPAPAATGAATGGRQRGEMAKRSDDQNTTDSDPGPPDGMQREDSTQSGTRGTASGQGESEEGEKGDTAESSTAEGTGGANSAGKEEAAASTGSKAHGGPRGSEQGGDKGQRAESSTDSDAGESETDAQSGAKGESAAASGSKAHGGPQGGERGGKKGQIGESSAVQDAEGTQSASTESQEGAPGHDSQSVSLTDPQQASRSDSGSSQARSADTTQTGGSKTASASTQNRSNPSSPSTSSDATGADASPTGKPESSQSESNPSPRPGTAPAQDQTPGAAPTTGRPEGTGSTASSEREGAETESDDGPESEQTGEAASSRTRQNTGSTGRSSQRTAPSSSDAPPDDPSEQRSLSSDSEENDRNDRAEEEMGEGDQDSARGDREASSEGSESGARPGQDSDSSGQGSRLAGEDRESSGKNTESGGKRGDSEEQSGQSAEKGETSSGQGTTPDKSSGQGTAASPSEGGPSEKAQPGSPRSPAGQETQGSSTGDATGDGSDAAFGESAGTAGSPRASAQAGGSQGGGKPSLDQLGQVGPGSPSMGTGGREGGVSTALPPATSGPAQDVAAPPTPDESPSLPSTGRIDRLVDTLDRELRSGTVDPALLQELGWDLPRARQFVDAYKRARQGGQRQRDRTELPVQRRKTTQPGGDLAVLPGQAGPGPARAFQADAPLSPDELRGVADPARQRVPARYRPLLEAYYRSISSQPAR